MSLEVLARGVVLGFSIAAPVGPIGLLVVRRALAEGRAAGLATGLGAATADAAYGAVAALGLTAVSGALAGGSVWLRIGGGLFLCAIGLRTMRARPAEAAASADRSSLGRAFVTSLALTISNPMTIVSFAAMMAGAGVVASGPAAAAFVPAVFVGSALWWVLLSGGVALFRSRVTPTVLRRINCASGLMLLAFGVAALVAAGR
jgi:threonine/homoserine/homoserine lactone efflux protein